MVSRFFGLVAFAACTLAAGAANAETVGTGFFSGIVTKVSDAARFRHTWVSLPVREIVLNQAWVATEGQVSVSFTPRFIDDESVHFTYTVSRLADGRTVPLSQGHLAATIGITTHLLAGDARFGDLVDVTVKIQDRRQGSGTAEAKRRKPERRDLYLRSLRKPKGAQTTSI